MNDQLLYARLNETVHKWTMVLPNFEPILDMIGDASVVLIGEATHGTHEFYDVRAEITKRLITEKGFNAVAVEADWPDAMRVNAYVHQRSDDQSAREALGDFERFPLWMWRNTVVEDFLKWLHDYNEQADENDMTGFYGIDLYSLQRSIRAVINYLDTIDPEAAQRARYRYSCFDHYDSDPQVYGYVTRHQVDEDCEDEVVQQLMEMQRKAMDYARQDGRRAKDAFFYAEQNARLAKNAEAYYRAMYRGRINSWNLRDTHMTETLIHLYEHLNQQQSHGKIVVWAHNSHLGDARATDFAQRGEINVGQLIREYFGDTACNLGFSTFTGTVSAASDWEAEIERKFVRPALIGSYEHLFHELAQPDFFVNLRDTSPSDLRESRLQRAIGVIYRPETERLSHYFYANLLEQFDGLIHLDTTTALTPLDIPSVWHAGEKVPDTFPFAQ